MLKSILFDYTDAYILVNETIIVLNAVATGATTNNNEKKVEF